MKRLPTQTTERAVQDLDFKQLYDRYNRLVYSRFIRHGFDPEDARDLLSKTFFQAYRGWPEFRRESSAKTWLTTIADRVAYNVFRDQGRLKNQGQTVSIEQTRDSETQRSLADTLEAHNPPASPLENLMAQEKVKFLWRALGRLPPQMRQVTILRLRNEYSYQEIADTLQVSLNTVRSQLHEARRRLRESVEASYDEVEL